MTRRCTYIAGCLMLCLFCSVGVSAADKQMLQTPYAQGEDGNPQKGVIGVSLQVGAQRIGDAAALYVAMVHSEGPAHHAGLAHGDEIVTVDGTALSGKSYEEVVKMIRGEPGTVVKLGVKGEGGTRELSIPRVSAETLSKGPSGSHGTPSR
jgi:C-terminal processing protease CtpA/Prc